MVIVLGAERQLAGAILLHDPDLCVMCWLSRLFIEVRPCKDNGIAIGFLLGGCIGLSLSHNHARGHEQQQERDRSEDADHKSLIVEHYRFSRPSSQTQPQKADDVDLFKVRRP